jgi:hypothetical protein
MLIIGIDVAIMAAYGLSLVVAAKLVTEARHAEPREGDGIVAAVFLSTAMMVLGYVAMALVLDMIAG